MERALFDARLCANDTLCADHESAPAGAHLNTAACHACLLVSETACEAGNHYLDRGLLVRTLRDAGATFAAAEVLAHPVAGTTPAAVAAPVDALMRGDISLVRRSSDSTRYEA